MSKGRVGNCRTGWSCTVMLAIYSPAGRGVAVEMTPPGPTVMQVVMTVMAAFPAAGSSDAATFVSRMALARPAPRAAGRRGAGDVSSPTSADRVL